MAAQSEKNRIDPASLVAVAIAAKQTRDRGLERAARNELREYHGIILRFTRGRKAAEL